VILKFQKIWSWENFFAYYNMWPLRVVQDPLWYFLVSQKQWRYFKENENKLKETSCRICNRYKYLNIAVIFQYNKYFGIFQNILQTLSLFFWGIFKMNILGIFSVSREIYVYNENLKNSFISSKTSFVDLINVYFMLFHKTQICSASFGRRE